MYTQQWINEGCDVRLQLYSVMRKLYKSGGILYTITNIHRRGWTPDIIINKIMDCTWIKSLELNKNISWLYNYRIAYYLSCTQILLLCCFGIYKSKNKTAVAYLAREPLTLFFSTLDLLPSFLHCCQLHPLFLVALAYFLNLLHENRNPLISVIRQII